MSELRLVFPPGDPAAPAQVDAKLVELLAKAQRARDTLLGEPTAVPPAERPHLTWQARLTYLAPDIVAAIMDGRQPAHLSAVSYCGRRTYLDAGWHSGWC